MNENPPRRPGGPLASRPLHFIWLADTSGSMRTGGKMAALNKAVRGSIPYMRLAARENPHATVFVNALCFGDTARWMDEKLIPVSEFDWKDVEAGGGTALGGALTLVGEVLQAPLMTDRALAPIIALVTDGLPTDDFQAGIDHLLSKPWGRRAVRIVVAIGEDAASTEAQDVFRAFMDNDSLRPFQANNPGALAGQIRWVATAVLKSISAPAGPVADAVAGLAAGRVASPPLSSETDEAPAGEADVW